MQLAMPVVWSDRCRLHVPGAEIWVGVRTPAVETAARSDAILEAVRAAGASLVVVTRGIKGAQAWHREAGLVEVQAPAIDVVDTIGAGDSFQAALLFALRAIGRIKRGTLVQLSSDELGRVLSFAATCAAFTCGRAGADPPRQSDVGPALSRLLT